MAKSPWPTIHAERRALAEDLEALTDEQWATASLCSGWSVQQVLAHMTATAEMTPVMFFPKLAGSGFKFNTLSEKEIAQRTKGTASETLARFKSRITSTKHPPGPVDSWLGETIIHSEDIRRPLKIEHDYDQDAVMRVADFYKKSNLVVGAKKRIAGLGLRATDADWTSGEGPEVAGPLLSLVMAITGRSAVTKDLTGDGVSTLHSRM
jgi:uncharacterized protein (TIGR03083 family)